MMFFKKNYLNYFENISENALETFIVYIIIVNIGVIFKDSMIN